MSNARFFYPPCIRYQIDSLHHIADDLFHRIARVLHHRIDDSIILFDGNSCVCQARITEIRSKSLTFLITSTHTVNQQTEPLFPLVLIQSICYGKQLDLIIQKAVELGIQDIYPVITQLSPHRSIEWLQKRSHHWEGIAISAAEQCGRNRLPRVHPCAPLMDIVSLFPKQHVWFCDHTIIKPLITDIPYPRCSHADPLAIVIGPEGGFAEDEHHFLSQFTQRVSLGPGILRVETAAISALSYIRLHHLKRYPDSMTQDS